MKFNAALVPPPFIKLLGTYKPNLPSSHVLQLFFCLRHRVERRTVFPL